MHLTTCLGKPATLIRGLGEPCMIIHAQSTGCHQQLIPAAKVPHALAQTTSALKPAKGKNPHAHSHAGTLAHLHARTLARARICICTYTARARVRERMVSVYMRIRTSIGICTCVSMCVCMFPWKCIRAYTQADVICRHVDIHIHICTDVCMHVFVHVHRCITCI